jgi:hypothetical protein
MGVFPRISMNPKIRFGKPCLAGTRMDVATVLSELTSGFLDPGGCLGVSIDGPIIWFFSLVLVMVCVGPESGFDSRPGHHGGLFTHTYLADPDGYVCEIQYGQ